jgi:NAD(P)-dependent dehydrogenase (short-subunit alcohol dehydrogenase family)
MAQRFAAEGMRLVLADIEPAPLLQLGEELRTAGADATAERVDVSNAADIERLAIKVYDEFGAAHLLCNNAGVFPPGAPIWKEPLNTWHWTLNVNFFGVLHGVQAFMPRMLEAGHEAHIVNTASLAGLTTRPLMSAYNVSKHAVVALSECLYAGQDPRLGAVSGLGKNTSRGEYAQ